MRDEIADVVFPVLRYGLRLRKRLLSGQAAKLDPQKERTHLLGLLQAQPNTPEARVDYSGDAGHTDSMRSRDGASAYDRYLGIRYALACWIDEIMIQRELPWSDFFNANSIEVELFGQRLRAVKFWDQVRRAQNRLARDPLEVFYLCVMLGFRGELPEWIKTIQTWREQVETQITGEDGFTPPPGQKVKPQVPPLNGAQRLQRMLLVATATITALVLIAVVFFLIASVFK